MYGVLILVVTAERVAWTWIYGVRWKLEPPGTLGVMLADSVLYNYYNSETILYAERVFLITGGWHFNDGSTCAGYIGPMIAGMGTWDNGDVLGPRFDADTSMCSGYLHTKAQGIGNWCRWKLQPRSRELGYSSLSAADHRGISFRHWRHSWHISVLQGLCCLSWLRGYCYDSVV